MSPPTIGSLGPSFADIKKKLETMFSGGSVQDEVDKVLTIEKGMKLEDLGDQFKTQPRRKGKEVRILRSPCYPCNTLLAAA